jgi:hypothetical protein
MWCMLCQEGEMNSGSEIGVIRHGMNWQIYVRGVARTAMTELSVSSGGGQSAAQPPSPCLPRRRHLPIPPAYTTD